MGWTKCGYILMFILLQSPAKNLLQKRSKPLAPFSLPNILPPFAMQALSVCYLMHHSQVWMWNSWVNLAVSVFSSWALHSCPFTPLLTPPKSFKSSAIGAISIKWNPLILMSVGWPTDKVTTRFSLTSWLVLANSGPRQLKFLNIYFWILFFLCVLGIAFLTFKTATAPLAKTGAVNDSVLFPNVLRAGKTTIIVQCS